ncbi:MAG: AAA family ATPase [Acidimicrobiia bacterium]|nr:AAA family ATPase [Acidimicrobiia bacterium]
MDENNDLRTSLVHLARLSLAGRDQDSVLYLQRLARRYRHVDPELADALVGMLRETPTRSSPLRRTAATPLPVEGDSRLALVRVEDPPTIDESPILPGGVQASLQQLIDERHRVHELANSGLAPTRTALLLGPPGVGKTMTARWIAAALGLPLLVLDLSAVMSSLLGRTGMNVRYALDYAKGHECVLLIDELDSIGKRRDDEGDVGELKRLVNVLLQQLDDWPILAGLLLGATNHPELLDPAIWRRFEMTIELPMPDRAARRAAVHRFAYGAFSPQAEAVLVRVFDGLSFSEIESATQRARRASALGYGSPDECASELCAEYVHRLQPRERQSLAATLVRDVGLSQRHAHRLTGVSRDTIRNQLRTSR